MLICIAHLYTNRHTQISFMLIKKARSIHRKIVGSGFLVFLFVRHRVPNRTAEAGIRCHTSHLQQARVPEAEILIRGCQETRREGKGAKKSIKLSMKMASKGGWVSPFYFEWEFSSFELYLLENTTLSFVL